MAETDSLLEKYLLDEMSETQRAEFEEHLFGCPICSERVRQDFTIIQNLKALSPDQILDTNSMPGSSWKSLWRINTLVPTFAALVLACVVCVQNFGGSPGDLARVLPQLAVLQPVTRGANDVVSIKVDRKLPTFQLSVNADTVPAGSFVIDVETAGGAKILTLNTGSENTALDLLVQLPTKSFPAGRYRLLLRPAAEPDSIITYPFLIEDSK